MPQKRKGWKLELKVQGVNGLHYRETGFCADSINARAKLEFFNDNIAMGEKAIGFVMYETTLPEWWKESERC